LRFRFLKRNCNLCFAENLSESNTEKVAEINNRKAEAGKCWGKRTSIEVKMFVLKTF